MKLINLFFLSLMFAAVLSLTSCNEEPVTSVTPGVNNTPLTKFTLPEGATFVSATLNLYKAQGRPRDINVHEVNVAWDESETWNTFYVKPSPQYSALPFHTFNGGLAGFEISFDVTALVAAWLTDPTTNFGILLDEAASTPNTLFELASVENDTIPGPHLVINYLDGNNNAQQTTEYASLDTYISSLLPDDSYGESDFLVTAKPSNYTKQTLIWFDLDMAPPSGGCTLTPGYWKTHSEFGPAPYDDTWAQLPNGANTVFFLSGQSYYEVLWTPPAGNAYYNLSFHYIAAGLNFLNGADPSAAQAAYDAATILFNTYTPAQIKALKGNNPIRAQFINLAGILGDYNEGIIGPGHCD